MLQAVTNGEKHSFLYENAGEIKVNVHLTVAKNESDKNGKTENIVVTACNMHCRQSASAL